MQKSFPDYIIKKIYTIIIPFYVSGHGTQYYFLTANANIVFGQQSKAYQWLCPSCHSWWECRANSLSDCWSELGFHSVRKRWIITHFGKRKKREKKEKKKCTDRPRKALVLGDIGNVQRLHGVFNILGVHIVNLAVIVAPEKKHTKRKSFTTKHLVSSSLGIIHWTLVDTMIP